MLFRSPEESPGGGTKAGPPSGRALALFDLHEIMQEKNPVRVIGVEEPAVGTSVQLLFLWIYPVTVGVFPGPGHSSIKWG